MSRKGNCWDNAVAESFFHTLKVELIRDERFQTREQLQQAVFEYIEVDYNRHRRHSAVGHISPMAFEATNGRLTTCPLLLGKINIPNRRLGLCVANHSVNVSTRQST